MKKIKALLVGLVALLPFAANAEEVSTNYYTYTQGDVVNFYASKEMEDAHKAGTGAGGYETIILEDKGKTDEYVRTWLIGAVAGSTINSDDFIKNDLRQMDAYNEAWLRNFPEAPAVGDESSTSKYFYDLTNDDQGIRLPSLRNMETLGAVLDEAGQAYVFPNIAEKTFKDRAGNSVSLLDELNISFAARASAKNGALLKEVVLDENDPTDETKAKRWVLVFQFDEEGKKITNATIELLGYTDVVNGKKFAIAPVVWFNKTADCHVDTPPAKVCYKCVGTDGKDVFKEGLEGDAEFAACTVTEAKDCNPKTGKKSYILEFAIVAALCTISLIIVKRKDLFRSI